MWMQELKNFCKGNQYKQQGKTKQENSKTKQKNSSSRKQKRQLNVKDVEVQQKCARPKQENKKAKTEI